MAINEIERHAKDGNGRGFPKRTKEDRELDKQFLQGLISEEPYVTGNAALPLLLEYVKERGRDYTISRQMVNIELRDARTTMVKYSRENILHHVNDTLGIIEENIIIATEEVQRRLTPRQEETIEMEEINASDISGLTIEETFVLSKLQSKLSKKKIKIKKIAAGSGLKEAMDIVFMWVDAKRKLLGLDAPKVIHKKTEKEVRKETFSRHDLEVKIQNAGLDTQKLAALLESFRNEERGQKDDRQNDSETREVKDA